MRYDPKPDCYGCIENPRTDYCTFGRLDYISSISRDFDLCENGDSSVVDLERNLDMTIMTISIFLYYLGTHCARPHAE